MSSSLCIVSVVIPTYNRAHLICGALDSVRDQSYRPIEVVVVDDGSSDNTAEVVMHWYDTLETDSGLSLNYLQQENTGGNAARNAGILAARGRYVAFLDSDDRWHSDKLTRQCEILDKDNRVGAIYCGVQHVDLSSGQVIEPATRDYPVGELLGRLLVRDITAPTSTYLIRREVFDAVGLFDETLKARQDWDMWIRVGARYHIGAVPMALVDYCEHGGPRTASDPQREIVAYKTIMEKYASLRAVQSLAVRRAATSAFYRRMGRVHLHSKLGSLKALGFYISALCVWPFDFDNYAALGGWFLPDAQRRTLHRAWNRFFGKTFLAIRSH
jgi:glycosyltransferase involved in cell wall biosynthesis